MSETPDDETLPAPERKRPSLDAPDTVLEALAEKTGLVSRVHLRDDDSGRVATAGKAMESGDAAPEGRGNYKLLGEIARGGMGVVLRGHDTDLGRDVAMKVLSKDLAGRPEVVQRFVEEAQIGGQLQHPGVVPVYELGLMADDRPYFTMKLVKGRTLAALLADRKSLDEDRSRLLSIFESICQTVAYAHSKGVIHRDLKPANVMVGAFGEVQVVDWGLAKVLGSGGVADELRAQQTQLTVIETVRSGPGSSGSDSLAGSVLGTPAYMSPEQANGDLEKVDERSDVFALGAILCEIFTGKPPYVETKKERVIVQAARARLDAARERVEAANADTELKELCLECLTANKSARPRNAEEVARRVQEHLSSLEQRAHDAQLAAERERIEATEQRRRQRLTLALAATVVIALVGLGAGVRFVEKQGAAREAAELASVREAVDEARGRASELSDEERYAEALEVARGALDRVTGSRADVAEERASLERLVAQVEGRVAEQGRRADLSARNAALLARCDDLRMMQIEANFGFSDLDLPERLDEMYAEAFRDYGIDLDREDLLATMETLRASGIAVEAGLALDDWAAVRRPIHGAASFEVEAVTALAFDLDPDPARTRIREALLAWDEERLLELARSEDLTALPPSTIWVLSQGLRGLNVLPGRGWVFRLDTPASRELFRVVREGVSRHPADFLLNFRFGELLYDLGHAKEAVAYFMAARSVRPDNAAIHGLLGDALNELGDSTMAWRAYKRFTELRTDVPRIHGFVAQYALFSGEFEVAVESFGRLIQSGGASPTQRFLRDVARSYAGEVPLADVVDRALRTDQDDDLDGWAAWALVAHPDPRQRDPERALAIYDDHPEWDPVETPVGQLLARLHGGREREALELVRRCEVENVGTGPGRTIREFVAAGAHYRLGNESEARRHLAIAEKLWDEMRYFGTEASERSSLGVLAKEVAELIGD
jgi:serine/threonine-protein kinase